MAYLVDRYEISERRACKLVEQNRSTQRYAGMGSEEDERWVAMTSPAGVEHRVVNRAPVTDPLHREGPMAGSMPPDESDAPDGPLQRPWGQPPPSPRQAPDGPIPAVAPAPAIKTALEKPISKNTHSGTVRKKGPFQILA